MAILITCITIFLFFIIAIGIFFYKLYAGCKKVVDKRIECEVKTIMILQHRTQIIVEKSLLLESRINECIYMAELTEQLTERNNKLIQSMRIPNLD